MGVPLNRSSPKKLNSEQCLCQISVSMVSMILKKIKKGFPKMINDVKQSFHSHFSQNERVTRVTLGVGKYLPLLWIKFVILVFSQFVFFQINAWY